MGKSENSYPYRWEATIHDLSLVQWVVSLFTQTAVSYGFVSPTESFMKGVFHNRPSLSKYRVTRAADLVLKFLRKWSPVRYPSEGQLSMKAVLRLVVTGQRLPNEVGVGWLCRCPGIVWEPIRKRAHTQLVRKHSITVISARWATLDWSWPKEWNQCVRANLH